MTDYWHCSDCLQLTEYVNLHDNHSPQLSRHWTGRESLEGNKGKCLVGPSSVQNRPWPPLTQAAQNPMVMLPAVSQASFPLSVLLLACPGLLLEQAEQAKQALFGQGSKS